MSTYLLAFVVGEFDFVEATDSDGVLIRVYTPLWQEGARTIRSGRGYESSPLL